MKRRPTEQGKRWNNADQDVGVNGGTRGKYEQSFLCAIGYQIKKAPDQKDRLGPLGGREGEEGRRVGMDFLVQLLRKLLIFFLFTMMSSK